MARILVTDDDDDVRSFLADALELAGHQVEQARDGVSALARLQKRSFHLLLTDLKMPRMDGMSLLKRVKAEQPELEVIVLTAHGTVANAVEAMKLGAFEYLLKPLHSPAELRLVVDRAIERRGLRDLAERAGDQASGQQLSYGAPAMEPVQRALSRVAKTDATVLLTGESGVGKEVTARALHDWSRRAQRPFLAINCAALSDQFLESELFGHERGAFTGADRRKRGKLELADGGTFFLDEVGELKPELQARLLRVIQERRFERLGGTLTIEVDVRWVAATNRDLVREVQEGRFRADLYHRLAVFPIQLPALRERAEDIPALAQVLLERAAGSVGRRGLQLSPAAVRRLQEAAWPGNIRELANCLERAAILADGETIQPDDLWMLGPPAARAPDTRLRTIEEAEREAIEAALSATRGNRKRSAEILGIGERTLYDKLKKYGLR